MQAHQRQVQAERMDCRLQCSARVAAAVASTVAAAHDEIERSTTHLQLIMLPLHAHDPEITTGGAGAAF